MREKARNRRSEYEVSRKPRMARVSSEPASVPPKKNDTGTSSDVAMRTSRPAPTRFTPFSYFCTCWKVTPSRLPSSVCDMPLAMRRARIRWPTSMSSEFVLFVLDFIGIAATLPQLGSTMTQVSVAARALDYCESEFTHRWVARLPGGYCGGKE